MLIDFRLMGSENCSRAEFLKQQDEMRKAKHDAIKCHKMQTKPGYEAIITNTISKAKE